MKIIILGAGYVGLTTGAALAYLGHEVGWVDKNEQLISLLKAGHLPIHEPGLQEILQGQWNRLSFSARLPELMDASPEVIMIAVGTPSGQHGEANLSYVEAAAREIGVSLQPGMEPVVVVKSTVPLGSTQRVQQLIGQELERRGLKIPFTVASNPEFLREGAALHDTFYPDRIVVGAYDDRAIACLRRLYAPILEQTFTPPSEVPRPEGFPWPVLVTTTPTSAELAKYAANSFLAMKISFANEMAGLAEKAGADISEVMRVVGLDRRIGTRYLEAGVGWGGSCLGKDTAALLHTAADYGYSLPLVEAAVEVNRRQRLVVINKLQEALKVIRGCTITLLGLAFKPDTDDLRDAPAIDIAAHLLERGARVRAYDPVAMERAQREYPELAVEYGSSVLEAAWGADALVLITEWEEFRRLPLADLRAVMRRPIIIDGRNVLDPEQVRREQFAYWGIGR